LDQSRFGNHHGQSGDRKSVQEFFLEGSPMDHSVARHIGMEALRRFKVIFD